jgi:cytoskeletal protein RodZ
MLTVGQILRTTREKKNLSLQQVEKHSRIRAKFLQALEENNWSSFSSKIYITGLIKNYSKFLGLDENKMLAFFRRDYERSEETRFRQRISTRSLMPETRTVIYVGLFIVFLLFSVYFGYQIKIYLTPPKVTVVSPQKSTFRSTSRIQVIGRTEKEAMKNILRA